ncbi:MAG TPA: malonyl-CoA synthase [Paracoccaceae bacterium]|nr:malonyl-CoA synthase [Paracoccaceae bacterium]
MLTSECNVQNNNLFSRLATHFPRDLSARFAELTDGRHYSYGDLEQVTARFAVALRGMGVEPGDRVAVQVEKSIEAFMLYLATVRAGAVFLPLNTAYTPAEVEYFVTDAEPALFVCAPQKAEALRPRADKAGSRLETMGVWRAGMDPADMGTFFGQVPERAEFRTVERAADDLATILYTSGTTGRSKGAMTTHENLYSNAVTLAEYWHFSADDVLLHALPIFHTHGLFTSCNTVLASGSSMIWLPRFDADEVIRLLPQATSMMGVPTFYTRLLDHPGFTRDLTAHMRLFTSGSAPLLAETHERFSERTGHAILERYGMTETQMNTSNPYDGDRRPGTVGLPLPGVELRIAEPESGRALAPGEVGMIEVRGPNIFKGYWRMPEKTKEEFRADGFFITGDLGKIDGDGYVHIVGRAKDLVISGGYNVYPKEIEEAIDALPGVRESAVIGVPHPDFGEAVVAVVIAEPGATLTEEQVVGGLSEQLARFKQPKRVFFADSLPRNTMGKVQKKDLREAHGATFAPAAG